jgi:hypothetical protein
VLNLLATIDEMMIMVCLLLTGLKNILELSMFEIWDGDLYLYSVDTEYEADEQREAGFTVKCLEYYGA